MNYSRLRDELKRYYYVTSYEKAEDFFIKCTQKLDSLYRDGMSAYEMKAVQYRTIADMLEPVIFENSPFYYETGVIPGFSDGVRDYKGHCHAGGWTYNRNRHLFIDQDEELYKLKTRQVRELLYLVCGAYNDSGQHFLLNMRKIFDIGLSGIYAKAAAELEASDDASEREFLHAVCEALLSLKVMAEKFSEKAEQLARLHPDNENYKRIADGAKRCPWEKPTSFYEALNTCALMRKAVGTFEGIGPNSFGRLDMDLFEFYKADINDGRITRDGAYSLISQFLITWDSHYDHDMKMVGYSDHELENTYVLGGCDSVGRPVFNELTEMFLRANREHGIIFPKIKCRFSANSPKEYLDLINEPVINGTSTILYVNDDTVIPALVRSGRTLSEARDYLVSGCWGLFTNCNDCRDDASYMNILKIFEFQIHNRTDKMLEVNMQLRPIDDVESFEEVYRITLDNINVFFKERTRVVTKGAQIWSKVDPLALYSAIINDCIENRRDFTDCGTKYKDDVYMCVGFPNVVDSLLVIKKLCFDEKKYTLGELLNAVRGNWEGYERMRLEAIACPGWGDGCDESNAFARRFHTDLYNLLCGLRGVHGGRVHLGHMTYTEIRFWGEKTLATPDGRLNGDYFAQGLTPSRLKKIPSVTSVGSALCALDRTELAGNNVVNIILPEGMTLDGCETFLRAFADTAMESLQLNCVSKETLLDAQKHPEKYPELIVRVCGFSAKFTSLSPEWQAEVLSRNFYE